MTLKEWLNGVYYDKHGQHIWKEYSDGDNQMIVSIRGWGAIKHLFKTEQEAMNFQDEVGKFIADAINEKVKRELL
jgi:hypothetical protein